MIDLVNYKRALQWLQRSILEQAREPEKQVLIDSLSHSFEVTYNLTEKILRQALVHLSDDPLLPGISSAELMRFAADEGLTITTPKAWLQYGLAIEDAKDLSKGSEATEDTLRLAPLYLQELEAFASRLEARLVPIAA